jgi:hypothetical protein
MGAGLASGTVGFAGGTIGAYTPTGYTSRVDLFHIDDLLPKTTPVEVEQSSEDEW